MISSNGNIGNHQWAQLPTDPTLGAERAEHVSGTILFEPHTPPRRLYFIHIGQVRTYQVGSDDSVRLLEILGPGDWFGEEALAGADTHSSRAVAATDTVLWTVPIDRLTGFLRRQPHAALELIRQLALRLRAAREDASRFVFDDCGARLIQTLLRFSQTSAATTQEDGTVMLRITHRQLAEAVGAARETVSLALTELREKKLMRTGRNRLMFQPSALKAIAHDGHPRKPVMASAG